MFRGGVVGGDREVLNMTDFINFNYRVTQLNFNMVIPPLYPPPPSMFLMSYLVPTLLGVDILQQGGYVQLRTALVFLLLHL